MGRLSGFIGGVVLSSSVIYLATSQLARQTQRNSHTLRESCAILEATVDASKRTQALVPYVEIPRPLEDVKDRWNSELRNAYKWAMHLDVVRVRERTEDIAGNIYRKITEKS
ncbi:hypothetical protein EX30DRAFT_329281 [Ascodesmis nigricans]|uniref:MICOS complex subunit MIC12 n=1 Tax=Ascodesmis nigricans TaxID=341454 RepID=A0A4S2N233_9PEZI|nr:hypothetical protein EX30DRAFT_329281 [Ascodesmis nigricans]